MKRIGLALLIASVSSLATACSTVEEKVQTPIAQKENVALTKQEISDAFNGKKQTPPEVRAEVSDGLLAQIKSEQPLFNEEKHGYFRVVGDSMTPNLYEGDTVKLVSSEYIEGDFVALTVNATGEHLVKQYVDGTLVSSNASGAYYQLEDVTIHGKVERQVAQDVTVKQTLQAAAGIYVVDSASFDGGAIYVLLSDGKVYGRSSNNGSLPSGTSTGDWSNTSNTWYLSGSSIPIPNGVLPISIVSITGTRGAIYVLLSDGKVYGRNTSQSTVPGSNIASGWQENSANTAWYLDAVSIPQVLVAPPTGGSTSVPQNRIVGRISAGTGDAEYLTAAQTKTMLGIDETKPTNEAYYPIGTTAASIGMVEVQNYSATEKVWQSTKNGNIIYHAVTLYQLPTSTGDLRIN